MIEELMFKDSLGAINDQVVTSLVQMYDIHFPYNFNDKKQLLADMCTKNSKDTVNAQIYV